MSRRPKRPNWLIPMVLITVIWIALASHTFHLNINVVWLVATHFVAFSVGFNVAVRVNGWQMIKAGKRRALTGRW